MNTTPLSLHLQGYIALQEALGYFMRPRARMLRQFVAYVEGRGVEGPLTAQIAVDWACAASDRCGTSGRAARLTAARGFLEYLSALVPGTEIPNARLLVRPPRRRPFLFTTTEVASLLDAALRLGPPGSLRPHTAATFLGLLATTGLRVSEARKLQVSDVRFHADPPQVVIRQTKFRKTRLVPIHETTAERLRFYAQQRRRMHYDGLSDSFFVSEQGGPMSYMAVYRLFQNLLQRLGISARNGNRKPSLHSFRHGFAVERLLQWQRQGLNLQVCIQHLSVYLGHVDPKSTFWYLTATPALLNGTADIFAAYAEKEGD